MSKIQYFFCFSVFFSVFLPKKIILMVRHQIPINHKLYDEIRTYCSLNNLKITDYCNEALQKAIAYSKFGDAPFMENNTIIKDITLESNPVNDNIVYTLVEESPKTIDSQAFSTEINANENEYAQKEVKPKSKKRKLA